MGIKNESHLVNILETLISSKTLSSLDLKASNYNQHFNTIKHYAIALIEILQKNLTHLGCHKERGLHLEKENVAQANKYLQKLFGAT